MRHPYVDLVLEQNSRIGRSVLRHPRKCSTHLQSSQHHQREELGDDCVLMDLLSAEAVCVLGYVTLLHSILPLHDSGGNCYHQTQTNLMSPASFPLLLFRLAVKFRYTLLV